MMNGTQKIPSSLGLAANALKEWLIDEGDWEGETKDEFRDCNRRPMRSRNGKRPRSYRRPKW